MTSRIIVDQLEGKPGSGNIVTVPTGHTLYAPGAVIQVVHETINTQKTNASDGLTDSVWQFTGVTASITPKFDTSKILIQYNQSYFWQTNGPGAQGHGTQLRRGNSTVLTTRKGFAGHFLDPGDASNHRHHGYEYCSHMDSPNTTSAVTYNVYGWFWTSDWASLVYQYNNGTDDSPSTITLMEIGA
jgi:hypothetical protein